MVINSAAVILDASLDFGAANLPLAAVKTAAPKLLSHTKPEVRETAMKIIAEMCRAFRSKAPLQDLLDGLKKAQLSQLDGLLQSQADPSPVRVGFRSAPASDGSSGDALAALEAQAKELEAERFASRPAVNIYRELPKTEYSTKIILAKWSEKVAALDMLIACGGEKPFKLAQPSPDISYASTISDMKKLLSHTHFAVCSKAMAVLSMLAEGVGEKLYPYLRPLLSNLTQLSKDKKLTRASGACLDVFFGHIVSIEHLLDKDDSLPSQLDERTQKNALARESVINYLSRCIERREQAGPRGAISTKSMNRATKLLSSKLADTNASVRKAATEALKVCLKVDDESLATVAEEVVDELQSSNPRAYKTLSAAKSSIKKKKTDAVETKNAAPADTNHSAKESASAPASKGRPVGRGKGQAASATKPSGSSTGNSSSAATKPTDGSGGAPVISGPVGKSEVGAMSYDDAYEQLEAMGVPNWDLSEDDGGVAECIKCECCCCRIWDLCVSLCVYVFSFLVGPEGIWPAHALSSFLPSS